MAPPVQCEPLDGAAIQGPVQHYVMTLPEAPVGEIAQEVLGETLGLPVTVDERIDARIGFRVDGLYSPKELAREFGYRLWNVDVVLIEDPADGLMLIPTSALAAAVKDGDRVVSPLALDAAGPVKASTDSPRTPITYGEDRWDRGGLRFFAAGVVGWLMGLLTFGAILIVRSQRRTASSASEPLLLIAREGLQPSPPRSEYSSQGQEVHK